MADGVKRGRGRPPGDPDQVKRASFNTRLRPALKQALMEAARQASRSLSEEIEFRLERSVQDQHMATALRLGVHIGSTLVKGLSVLSENTEMKGSTARHVSAIRAMGELIQASGIYEGGLGSLMGQAKKISPQLVSLLDQFDESLDPFHPGGARAGAKERARRQAMSSDEFREKVQREHEKKVRQIAKEKGTTPEVINQRLQTAFEASSPPPPTRKPRAKNRP
jgi:hypothetical protein